MKWCNPLELWVNEKKTTRRGENWHNIFFVSNQYIDMCSTGISAVRGTNRHTIGNELNEFHNTTQCNVWQYCWQRSETCILWQYTRYDVCDAIIENCVNNGHSVYYKYYHILRATECKTYMQFSWRVNSALVQNYCVIYL